MSVLLVLLLAVQQWTAPIRVSPDTLPGTHPAICWGRGWAWKEICVCWHSSDHLWSRFNIADSWSEPILVDTAHCLEPSVTTSSMYGNWYVGIAWTDLNDYIRLSIHEPGPPWLWSTTAPDIRIKGYNPAIASDGAGRVWCVWTKSGPTSYYLLSYYDGNNWANPDTLKEFVPVEITYTAGITTDYEDNVLVSYNDHDHIWVQYWEGNTLSNPESIGICFDYAYPTMYSDSSHVWVSWFNSEANGGEGGIFARYYDGVRWSDLIEFPHYFDQFSGWHNSHADICLDSRGRLWAGWWETKAIWCPNYLITANSYKEAVWEEISAVDSFVDAWGGYPSIACGDDKVWMVWQSGKEGDWYIYTSHTEVTGVEETIPISSSSYDVLLESYPDPFDLSTSISYSLPMDCKVVLAIYNIQGQLVRTLLKGEERAGNHTVTWGGRDYNGRKVSSGPYFLRLRAHPYGSVRDAGLGTREYTVTRKLSVMR